MSKTLVTAAAVEECLRAAWGGPVTLETGDANGLSDREHVHRFRVRGAPARAPGSVIVKQPRLDDGEEYDRASNNPAIVRFFNEWACLQLLTDVSPDPPSPRVYCGSARHGFIVMEDFGAGDRLDDVLLSGDAGRAAASLVALFETVGRMHASTRGKRERLTGFLEQHGRTLPHQDGTGPQWFETLDRVMERLPGSPVPGFLEEMTDVSRRLDSAGAFEALVHGDICPDNCHWTNGRVRLLDFEHGRFGSIFVDACYPRILFPTCWCVSRLPAAVVEDAVRAYREQLSAVAPRMPEQEFERGMLDASIRWAWGPFATRYMPGVLERDREWGLVTIRQRILYRFQLLLDMLERHPFYPRIAETTRRTHAFLSRQWPEAAVMPFYPAFR